jgi:uncharacterized membrane protein
MSFFAVGAGTSQRADNETPQEASKLSQRAKCIGWVVLAILAFITLVSLFVLGLAAGMFLSTFIFPLPLGITYVILISGAIGGVMALSAAVGYLVSNSQGILKAVRPDIISALE